MKRVLLSVGLGLLAPFVYILGAKPFEAQGKNSVKEIVAGSLVLALCSAVCTFLLTRKGGLGFRANRPILIGMLGSLLAMCVLIVLLEGGRSWLVSALPILLSGCAGSAAGVLLADLGNRRASPAV